MTVAAVLLAYAAGVGTLGARRLLRAMTAALALGPPVMALAPARLGLALGRVPHP